MKNKHLALFMALIMCFSLVFGASAATEGTQIMPSTSAVSPTEEEDIADKVGDILGDVAGDELSQAGQEIMNGAEEAHGFLASFMKIIENMKVFFANLINTIFPFFGIGTGDSLLG
ncbi:MAG: hypothetical protein E7543_05280 [Ruminococcaceae bacterium]|nr:hypothetical protein [Oscillospiraceae bacterium]